MHHTVGCDYDNSRPVHKPGNRRQNDDDKSKAAEDGHGSPGLGNSYRRKEHHSWQNTHEPGKHLFTARRWL